ncbi:ependymin-like [Cynoglossus semilaevis]|uniref:ependymin-like n=1 Tax=Cynoglossus semilaevis TaxID=244447 RepID=UPI00049789F9|nr:ependymin-like [Cynoglossus semilaevis]
MNFLGVLTCVSVLLAAASTQAPKHCVSPPLMSGQFTLMAGNGVYLSTGSISSDAFGKRMRVRNNVMVGNQSTGIDELMLFNEEAYYEINWKTISCKKKQLDSSFIPMHVPEDARLMGQVIMGSSSSWGMGVLVNTWYGTLPNNGSYSTVFSEIGCIPMTYSVHYPQTGWITLSTYNWVLGNVNPMDYHPPFFCQKAKLEVSDMPPNFFTVLHSLALQSKKDE